MSESEFWHALRFQINSAAPASSDQAQLGYCDWFEVRRTTVGGSQPRVEGRVGFVSGRNANTWKFTLLLPVAVRCQEEIDWALLLSKAGSEGWLEFDTFHRNIVINTHSSVTATNLMKTLRK